MSARNASDILSVTTLPPLPLLRNHDRVGSMALHRVLAPRKNCHTHYHGYYPSQSSPQDCDRDTQALDLRQILASGSHIMRKDLRCHMQCARGKNRLCCEYGKRALRFHPGEHEVIHPIDNQRRDRLVDCKLLHWTHMKHAIDVNMDHGNGLDHMGRGSETGHVFRNSVRSENMGHASVMVY